MESTISTVGPRDRYDATALPSSGVSWGAILSGAFVAAALALILLVLGTGLGLSAASPWAHEGASAKTLGVATIVWLIFVHLSSSAIGGYMAGRLRTKWTDVRTTEVFFRDTAHGLTAWAVGIVLTAAFLTSAATAIVGGAAKTAAAGATAVAGAGAAAGANEAKKDDASGYLIDGLFRTDGSRDEGDASLRQEVGRIFANGTAQGEVSAADRTYVAQTIATRTGISQPEAEKRVNDAIAQAKAAELKAREAADAARKAAAQLAMWSFLALLIGAFTASFTATIGGRLRDGALITTTAA